MSTDIIFLHWMWQLSKKYAGRLGKREVCEWMCEIGNCIEEEGLLCLC